MSLETWSRNGWLRPYRTTPAQITELFAIADRDLEDARTERLSTDWQFGIAYNAALKTRILPIALTILLSGCAQTPKPRTSNAPERQEERVSDRYSRDAVKTYELFRTDIEGYVIMLVHIADGESFPMLCRKTRDGVYPIPQSVFVGPGADRWTIICEPVIRNAYTLIHIDLSKAGEVLVMGDRRLRSCAKTPLLSAPD